MGAMAVQERLVEVAASEYSERTARAPAGEEKTFRSYDPDQVLLMAPVLREWLPEGDLAHFVSDLVESGALDLSAIYASYEGAGYPPYDPRLMVKLLLYGYATRDVFQKAGGGELQGCGGADVVRRQHPDYRSIARFRKRHLEALAGLFVGALRLCKQAQLLSLGALALDSTKLRANASPQGDELRAMVRKRRSWRARSPSCAKRGCAARRRRARRSAGGRALRA